MKVYRIEDIDGNGCYQSIDSSTWRERSHNTFSHPTPNMCPILSNLDNDNTLSQYHFGFKDLYQLSKWFNSKEIENLLYLGFTIREYNVNKKDIILATKQIVFKKACNR